MPRKLRIEYPGAIYHVIDRGDRQEDIFLHDMDRQDFIKTLAEACQKTRFQVHAYCLMRNHFHLVVETPNANLVAGMKWFLGSYTNRLNHRHKIVGHVFSGRYKALLVDGTGGGYLRTVCDYVHLNPVRAKLLGSEERLLAYPWSSLIWYQAAPEYRPTWIRTDRLLGEHGIQRDTAEGRRQYEERLEARRRMEEDPEASVPLRRGWCFGSEEFRKHLVELMEGKLGENHSAEMRRETAQAKAERIIAEEFGRLGWTEKDLEMRLKKDPLKLALATRLRKETTLSVKLIAERLHLGSWKSANSNLHQWAKQNPKTPPAQPTV